MVSRSLESYSDFGKALKDQVKEQLQINLGELDIPSYNHFIVSTIQEHFNAVLHEQGVNRMKEQLDELLLHSKEEYKLSELMKELVREIEDLDEIGYDEYHEMSMHIEEGYLTYVYFDAESNKDKYDCKYKICVDKKSSVVESIKIREKIVIQVTQQKNLRKKHSIQKQSWVDFMEWNERYSRCMRVKRS
ncbi:hypothetical protein OMD49_29315 [Bacillus anthracis]|nr:hypothetical protein [Bacillus anthracis]